MIVLSAIYYTINVWRNFCFLYNETSIVRGRIMNMQDIRERAKDFGIKTARMSKVNLIKEIQLSEGNFSCFASAVDGVCDQTACLWREECFSAAKKMHS